MKFIVLGCTLLLCSTLLYGARYITAAILDAGNTIAGPGLVGIDQALSWVGWGPNALMIGSFVLSVLCLTIGLRSSHSD